MDISRDTDERQNRLFTLDAETRSSALDQPAVRFNMHTPVRRGGVPGSAQSRREHAAAKDLSWRNNHGAVFRERRNRAVRHNGNNTLSLSACLPRRSYSGGKTFRNGVPPRWGVFINGRPPLPLEPHWGHTVHFISKPNTYISIMYVYKL